MSQKPKKKSNLFILFKKKEQRTEVELPEVSPAPPPQSFLKHPPAAVGPKQRPSIVIAAKNKFKRFSTGGLNDLVQCPLCLEKFNNAKMLPCQHTFCLACLKAYASDLSVLECPICAARVPITSPAYFDNLPSNLYIDSLLQLVGPSSSVNMLELQRTPSPPSTPVGASCDLFAAGIKCSLCKNMGDMCSSICCNHCKLHFCATCWTKHLDDLKTQIGSILKQLESSSSRLEHKAENFRDRCDRLKEQIGITAEDKINAIHSDKEALVKEAGELQKTGDMCALALKTSLIEAVGTVTKVITRTGHDTLKGENDNVSTYVNLHQNALQIINEVAKWDVQKFVFDKENFRIDFDTAAPSEAESEEPLAAGAGGRESDPLESEDSLVWHYRSRSFIPHYVWRKTPRPGGIAMSPWNNHLYICGMDTHNVLVVERTHAKIVARLTCEDMLCPTHIAFMKGLGEIYVTDKWKHCVHVFSKEGAHLRSIGQKGSRLGMFRSPEGIATDNSQQHIYVVDTGNDRVQILQPDGTYVGQIGVITKPAPTNRDTSRDTADTKFTELNAPTSVAVTRDRVIILDSGNRRVKIYNKQDKGKIFEFGSLGQRKGQFRQPEVLTVDPLGLILVGDSGNSRVQIFKPSGQLVRVFGGSGQEPGKFGWISGIHVTKELDIIISDTKNHNVNFI